MKHSITLITTLLVAPLLGFAAHAAEAPVVIPQNRNPSEKVRAEPQPVEVPAKP